MIAAKLEPDHYYDDTALRLNFGLRNNTVNRARLAGELRSTRRGGKTLYRGSWVESWLTGEPAAREPATVS